MDRADVVSLTNMENLEAKRNKGNMLEAIFSTEKHEYILTHPSPTRPNVDSIA